MPKRGLGDATIKLLHDHARKRRMPLMEATRAIVETDELKPKPRNALRDLVASFDRWRAQKDDVAARRAGADRARRDAATPRCGRRTARADAAGRLENLKELVRSMEEFENLTGFLEHISLVMDADKSEGGEAVSIMTMHSAKGLEFDTVFLPGWEEGLFPSQRTLDDQGRAGLEEERRLAHVGLTRARRRAKIYFAANRRMHGLWSSNIPSRFLDELPEAHVEVTEAKGGFASGMSGYGNAGASRFDEMTHFGSGYSTPGWQRAQAPRRLRRRRRFEEEDASQDYERRRTDMRTRPRSATRRSSARHGGPLPLAGERLPSSGGRTLRPRRRAPPRPAHHRRRAGRQIHRHRLRLHHRRPRVPPEIRQRQRRRNRRQQADNQFDKAGEKRVVDSFVERV